MQSIISTQNMVFIVKSNSIILDYKKVYMCVFVYDYDYLKILTKFCIKISRNV